MSDRGAISDRDIFYFAYGTNMCTRVLARRGLTPLSSEAARLGGYRLRFSHRGLIPTEPAFANIEPEMDGEVFGALHRLRGRDMARLDRIEGAEYLHVDLTVTGRDHGEVLARAYLDPAPAPGLRPSRRYLATCCEGARELGLPPAYVGALSAHPTRHIPILSPLTELLVRTGERLRLAGFRPERLRLAYEGRTGRKNEKS